LLLDDGKSAEFLYLDDDAVRNWHKQYQSGGLDLLTTFDWKGNPPRNQGDAEVEFSRQYERGDFDEDDKIQ